MNSNIKIAYIVLCHKNAGQINKMIKKLDSKNCDFFLHIDKKSSIEEDIIKNNHIFVLPNDKRIDVKWGDISMIDATVNLMESVFTSKIKYDYIWLISGQDFPLKSSQEIINFLEKNKGSLVPDESIFQTIYMNSRFKDKYYDKLTYVNWKGQINHPKTFTIEDCDELEKVNYLMARKFDEDFDDKIINKLYDEL